jgi:hypothetical protein
VSYKSNAGKNSVNGIFYSYADNLSNPRKLTINQLDEFCKNNCITNEDAQEIIEQLYKLSVVTYKIFKENGIK